MVPNHETVIKTVFKMNQTEFMILHATCVTAAEAYVTEARKTAAMLGNCAPAPLPFKERFALLTQEIVEKDAHVMYLQAKRLLHSAALLGYAALPRDSPAASFSLLKS